MLPYDIQGVHATRPTTVYVNSFSRVPIYEVDFGDEGSPVRPVLAIPHDLPDPVLIWPAPPPARMPGTRGGRSSGASRADPESGPCALPPRIRPSADKKK